MPLKPGEKHWLNNSSSSESANRTARSVAAGRAARGSAGRAASGRAESKQPMGGKLSLAAMMNKAKKERAPAPNATLRNRVAKANQKVQGRSTAAKSAKKKGHSTYKNSARRPVQRKDRTYEIPTESAQARIKNVIKNIVNTNKNALTGSQIKRFKKVRYEVDPRSYWGNVIQKLMPKVMRAVKGLDEDVKKERDQIERDIQTLEEAYSVNRHTGNFGNKQDMMNELKGRLVELGMSPPETLEKEMSALAIALEAAFRQNGAYNYHNERNEMVNNRYRLQNELLQQGNEAQYEQLEQVYEPEVRQTKKAPVAGQRQTVRGHQTHGQQAATREYKQTEKAQNQQQLAQERKERKLVAEAREELKNAKTKQITELQRKLNDPMTTAAEKKKATEELKKLGVKPKKQTVVQTAAEASVPQATENETLTRRTGLQLAATPIPTQTQRKLETA